MGKTWGGTMFGRRTFAVLAVGAALVAATAQTAAAAPSGTLVISSTTLAAHLDAAYSWTLGKSADPTSLNLTDGDSDTVSYTITATRSLTTTSSAYVDGTVCVRNNGTIATQGLQITEQIVRPPSKLVVASGVVDVSGHPVLAPGETHCYSFEFALSAPVPGATYRGTTFAQVTNRVGKGSGPTATASATLPGSASAANASLTVADTNGEQYTFTDSGTESYTTPYACPDDAGTQTDTVSAVGFVETGAVTTPTAASASVDVTCTPAFVQPTSVTLAASFDSEIGCASDWDPTCAQAHLTLDTSDGLWKGTFAIPAGVYDFKIAIDDSWTENYGAGGTANGTSMSAFPNGVDSLTFTYDPVTHLVTISPAPVVVAAGSFQSEVGCTGDWDPTCLTTSLQDSDGDGLYTYSTTELPAGNYETKIAINESWAVNYGTGGQQNGANIAFTVPVGGGTTTITFDVNTHQIVATSV